MSPLCEYNGKCETTGNRRDCQHYERCQQYENWRLLGRTFLALQGERVAQHLRVGKLHERHADEQLINIMSAHEIRFKHDERDFLKDCTSLLEKHAIFQWAEIVYGLGDAGAFILLHINPFKAQTIGQAKAFLGLAPGLGLKSGQKAKFDPAAKGRIWLLVNGLFMARDGAGDPYYRPIYDAKKQYLTVTRGMGEYVKNPSLCPDFQSCKTNLEQKARRLDRKTKAFPCKGHIDRLAKRFLAGIVVGNALEIMRVAEELPVDNLRSHHNYIAPKSYIDQTPDPELLQSLIMGQRADRWVK